MEEIDLAGACFAEYCDRNLNHIFQVIAPLRHLVLCADNRMEMEDWLMSLRKAALKDQTEISSDDSAMLSGYHSWYTCTHARPTYCNVCHEALSGVTSHGLSCEVCKFKAHKRCAVKASNNCKWTTLASIGQNIIEDEDGAISMPHQWLEGNLPVSAKCSVCDKTCGSVLRLQDWRCLWCKTTVHNSCRELTSRKCSLGQCRISCLPPTAISNLDSDGFWRASKPPGTSPLLVFVNSKSGDNQGIKMLRRFKQLLNPAQVFDLISAGPKKGLRLFQSFESFRVLVCAGDGSIGWVLSEIDRLGLHKQIGVLPLGTGNDLARVLGWGSSFDDETQLPTVLEQMEHAQISMLDRWSILSYEVTMPPVRTPTPPVEPISHYEDSVADHLAKILHSDNHSTVISSAKVLCETVKDFITKVGQEANDEKHKEDAMSHKCDVLNQKLDALLKTLEEESQASAFTQGEQDIPNRSCSPSSLHEAMSTSSLHASHPEILTIKQLTSELTQADSRIIRQDTESVDIVTRTTTDKSSGNTEKENQDVVRETGEKPLTTKPCVQELQAGDKPTTGSSEEEVLAVPVTAHAQKLVAVPVSVQEKASEGTVSNNKDSPTSEGSDEGRLTPPRRNGRPRRRPTSAVFRPKDQLMSRANSLKKAIRQIIEHTEKAVDFQNGLTEEMKKENLARYGKEYPSPSDVEDKQNIVIPNIVIDNDSYSNVSSLQQSSGVIGETKNTFTLSPSDIVVHHEADASCHGDSAESEIPRQQLLPTSDVLGNAQCVPDLTFSLYTGRNVPSKDKNAMASGDLSSSSADDNSQGENSNNVQTSASLDASMNLNVPKPTIQERRPLSGKNNLTINANYEVEKYENEDSEKPPLSPIPGSPSFYPSTPLQLSAASSEENLSSLHLQDIGAVSLEETTSLRVPSHTTPTPVSLATTMATLSVPSWGYSTDGESSACTTPRSLSPAPGSPTEKHSFFDAIIPPVTPTKSPQRSRHPFTRRISNISIYQQPSTSKREKSPSKEDKSRKFPILGVPIIPKLPGLAGLSSGAGGSFISQVLLANADVLCASASPLMEEDVHIDHYEEKCVMNNYFGIGVDAKISLDFHLKREEHPEKCRSRTKNFMWYGVISSKELVHKTFKNLEQRVQLECDGRRIPLPNLQGIVILNIPSYMGGINFWGSSVKHGESFLPLSFDDNILEVVAVFGCAQLGMSRFINLHRHRIAQCRSVKITILGEEPMPVQVDGEAWMQPPGYIRIEHKNRAQMLTRDKVFEEALKSWTDKQKLEKPVGPKHHILSESETEILRTFVEATETLIKSVKVASLYHSTIDQDLMHLATQASEFLERLYPAGRLAEPAIRKQVSDLVSSVRTLYNETTLFLQEKALACRLGQEVEEKLNSSLHAMEAEMKKVYEIGGLPHFHALKPEPSKRHKEKSKFRLMSRFIKSRKDKEQKAASPNVLLVHEWTPQDVGLWLESLGLSEYRNTFISNDIRGQELLGLGRTDLKELGVSKVGHVKRILHGVKEMKTKMVTSEKSSTSFG